MLMYNCVASSIRMFLENYISQGDIVVDATCGNGKDSRLLSELVGKTGQVKSFDIQPEAINNAKENNKDLDNITYFNNNHNEFKNILSPGIRAFIYNLGFLPGGNKKVVTHHKSTLESIKQALELLKSPGIITICLYSHEEGKKEQKEILKFAKTLTKPYDAYIFKRLNRNNPPYLVIITKS